MSIQLIRQGSIAHIVLDNGPVNAFTAAIHKQFYDVLQEFYNDSSLKVGIWRSAGEGAFCAGDDIKSPRPEYTDAQLMQRHFTPSEQLQDLGYPGWEREVLRLKRSKPLIAAVQGACVGQGLAYLLMLTDLRIGTPKARFGFPEITYGMGGAAGATQLNQQIPHTAAMYMVLTGKLVDADYALTHHLINEIVAEDQLLARAMELAQDIAKHPSLALQVELETYHQTKTMSREDALTYAEQVYRLQRFALSDGTQPLASTGRKDS